MVDQIHKNMNHYLQLQEHPHSNNLFILNISKILSRFQDLLEKELQALQLLELVLFSFICFIYKSNFYFLLFIEENFKYWLKIKFFFKTDKS